MKVFKRKINIKKDKCICKMKYIYVLSDPDSINFGKYKLGITSRSEEYLLRDYRRSRPEVKLFLFESTPNNSIIESMILKKFEKYRIPHESGTLSEWIKIDVNILIKEVKLHIQSHNEYKEYYTIKDFIKKDCVLGSYLSISCKDLYNYYLNNPVNKRKYGKYTFSKQIIRELNQYYKGTQIKYKSKGITYYKGINIKTDWSCVII